MEDDHRYFNVVWNKPWETPDVTYTLVAYDENDKMVGAIKKINGDERALAVIGSPIFKTSIYYYTYDDEKWTDTDMLRFRVIVNFPDDTAVVSQPLDKEFR